MSVASRSALSGIFQEMRGWARMLWPGGRYVAPYYPTPDAIIQRMLRLADVTAKDTVYDLGCGDGRMLVAAACLRGARGVGVELDPELAALAQDNVQQAGVQHLVRIVRGDAAATHAPDATVVLLYLSDHGNRQLMQSVGTSLQTGTKVVSFFFTVEGWERHLEVVDSKDNMSVYLYKSPPPPP